MISKEVFFDNDVGVRNLVGLEFTQALMIPSLIEILTIKRAGDRLLALFATALRADISPEGRAVALRSPSATNGAFFRHPYPIVTCEGG